MKFENEKCVMVIDEHLPLGIIANTAGIMGVTLGKQHPEIVGVPVVDKSQRSHVGLIEFPVPIIKGNVDTIRRLREELYEEKYQDVLVIDFSTLAQGCKCYEEYIEKMAHSDEAELVYMGITICGPKKKINKLTGSMPLLR